jgi:hypothetical protein
MAQFTIYRSTDTSAPTLSGTVGDLVNLLDKCLVTGYGSKVAAGWTKPFTGTNKAVFRMGAGNQLYLRVQDDAPGGAGAQESRMVGYEQMTSVDLGTRPFPNTTQLANGLFIRKSLTANATTRSWVVVADARTFYLFIMSGDSSAGTSSGVYLGHMFGEIYSLAPDDRYRTMIIGRHTENSGNFAQENLDRVNQDLLATTGHYMPRGYHGYGGSIQAGKHGDAARGVDSSVLAGNMAFPNPLDGGLYIAPLWVHDPTTTPTKSLRGRLRGLWQQLHAITNFADGDTFSGRLELDGKDFLIIKRGHGDGIYVVETSDTLETNI